MKIENLHIEFIKQAFATMKSNSDFLKLMNYAKSLLYGEKAYPFKFANINYYLSMRAVQKDDAGSEKSKIAQLLDLLEQSGVKVYSRTAYHKFTIGKKTGGVRVIHAPKNGLKEIQKCLNIILQAVYTPHEAATGFVEGKSIVDNASIHCKQNYVYNIDLKDFFSAVDQARFWKRLQYPPFNLMPDISETEFARIFLAKGLAAAEKVKSRRLILANTIASLCFTEMEVERKDENGNWTKVNKNVLPQGAPTSPTITNIICERLDRRLSGLAKRFGLKYSRYADDITFSSMHYEYSKDGEFIKELNRIITDQNFDIKDSKTRLQKQGYKQEVTGLVVNEQVNVNERYIKELRMWLYTWEKYGYEKAYNYFLLRYKTDKGHIKKGKPDMANVIAGKLDYLKMVKGSDNQLYSKLKGRFNLLIKVKPTSEDAIKTESDSNQVRITLEVFQFPKMNEKLKNSINIPKDTVLPSTIIIPNSIEEIEEFGEVQEENKSNMLFPHNPMYTIAFLKKFKMGDGTGFKELVHDVILSDETMLDILNKVKSHPNFISHYKGEKVANVSFLNRGIVMSVRQLINLFETEGIPFYKNGHKHPFNNDSKYTSYATQFKKKYRYGSGSEYSKLQSDIINIFKDQRVPVSSLSFMPDERKFNIRSSFFTWQPSIYNGIRYIVQGISDHSNINGARPFNPAAKNVLVEVERIQAESLSFVELRIFDCMSIAKIDSNTLLNFLQGSAPFIFDFRNLCDWIVECDFLEESSKRINLLTAPEYSQSAQEIEDLSFTVGGFKHKLRFYDVK